MSYCFARTVNGGFDEVVERVVGALKQEGFGVFTDIDVAGTMKQKLGVEFRKYRILGACNPRLADKALTADDKVGAMPPCNVIVQEPVPGQIEIAAIDPMAAMAQVGDAALEVVAREVAQALHRVVQAV